jgi:hypothetical protein
MNPSEVEALKLFAKELSEGQQKANEAIFTRLVEKLDGIGKPAAKAAPALRHTSVDIHRGIAHLLKVSKP